MPRELFPWGPMDRDPDEEMYGVTIISMRDPGWGPSKSLEVV